jgi:PAS domain S-box-containing protein
MLNEDKWKKLDVDVGSEGPSQLIEMLSGIVSSGGFSLRPNGSKHIASDRHPPIPDQSNHAARYRTLVEQIPAIVFMAYLDEGISEAYVSPQIEQLLGFTQEEWLDDPVRWFEHIHPDDKVRWSIEAATMFIKGEPLRSVYRMLARDGRVIWFHCEAKMVHRDDGVPWFIHGVAIDLTELKEAEAELRKAHDELEARVSKRTAELARANEDLQLEIAERELVEAERARLLEREREARRQAEAANRVKDEFLATVSHELRNPLNVIVGNAGILLRLDESGQSPLVRRAAETIQRNALAQAQLVSDLLDLSRLQMGKLDLDRQTVPLNPIINDAVDTVRAETQSKNISLQINLPSESLFVLGDAVRLRQIIWNLLNNAVKFTPRDGLVTITLETAGNEVILTIADNGQGIDPKFLPHVFDRFRQGDPSTTRFHGGMGIGLALVRQLVELHHGRVEAHSVGSGQGAQFTVWLPLQQQQQRTSRSAKIIKARRLVDVRVLVLDDSADTVEMLRKILEIEGALAETANCGAEALEILRHKKFDLLITDISMPGMDGFEVLRRLRAQPSTAALPAVALTGFGRIEDVARAEAEGFVSHLTKPIEIDELIETICSAMTSRGI